MGKEKVLLIGNGIYRAFHGEEESWENVLRFVKKEFEKQGMSLNLEPSSKISYSLYFEYLYAEWRKQNKSASWSDFAKQLAGVLNKNYEKGEFLECATPINKMIWNHFDILLTTNIDNRFEKFSEKKWSPIYNGEKFYSAYRRKDLKSSSKASSKSSNKTIFYMHGDLEKSASICFGLNHYLGSYKSLYDSLYGDDNDIIDLLKGDEGKIDEKEVPWLYHFFFNDVDIIGLGLNNDEIDIWWAIGKRFQYRLKRKDKSAEENSVKYFFPSIEIDSNHDKIELLRAMDVCPIVIPCSSYREFYKIYFEDFAGNNCLNEK